MSTALYRRYRPENFAQVIGQEQVTAPLMAALRNNKTNHAYLFSGPRGCGKTTSARILARCLNCAQGPTDTPCGVCESCIDLSRQGSGSLDVIEIDAASHGGVDDARDLRERATFAPARDRYKIFIIDEAHMVTSAGFNALLKIVEEPPEHIKFIFATTEPEKVIETIRSRTHHYPFRLVPPATLQKYLEQLCQEENISVEAGVLPLVIRGGGGSVRDSLSILDQLMNGSDHEAIGYDAAVKLLGFTNTNLLNQVLDGISSYDAEETFQGIDKIIQTGLDPRRFIEDLLEHFRDLIVLKAAPNSAASLLPTVTLEQREKMQVQASRFGIAQLSYCADQAATALNEMSGATSPRLHLELLSAKLLLPTASQEDSAVKTRIERLENRVITPQEKATASINTTTPETQVLSEQIQKQDQPLEQPSEPTHTKQAEVPPTPTADIQSDTVLTDADQPETIEPEKVQAETPQPESVVGEDLTPPAPEPIAQITVEEPVATEEPALVPAVVNQEAPVSVPPLPQNDSSTVEELRARWDEIMEALKHVKRSSWVLVNQNARVENATTNSIQLSFLTEGLAQTFNTQAHKQNLTQAITKVLGSTFALETVPARQQTGIIESPSPTVPLGNSFENNIQEQAPMTYQSQQVQSQAENAKDTAEPIPSTASFAPTPYEAVAQTTEKKTAFVKPQRPDPLKTPWTPAPEEYLEEESPSEEVVSENMPSFGLSKPEDIMHDEYEDVTAENSRSPQTSGADLLVEKLGATIVEEIQKER